MKILVTGGLGHIGSKLIMDLANRKDIEDIVILDNLLTQRYCSLMDLPNKIKYTFIKGDIRNKEDLEKATKDMDIVIHLAAITDAPETQKYPELTREVNYKAVKQLLKIAQENNVKKFFFPSTTSVYGPAKGRIDEKYESYTPLTPYAESKLLAEKEIIKANRKMKTCVARFGTIYGYSMGMRFHTAVNKFIFQAVHKEPLTIWEDALDQKRPYLDLDDSIRFINFFIDNENPKFFGEIFNVLTNNSTVMELIDIIKKYVLHVQIKLVKNPIINQQSYEVSRKRVEQQGFTFKGNMEKSIKETVEIFKAFI